MPVTLVEDGTCGSDLLFARAAWVQPPGEYGQASSGRDESVEAQRRVIKSLVTGRHTTPFEKGLMTVYVEAPMFVWWEWTRHRFMGSDIEDFGFSLSSGRYKVLDGQFYIPPADRPCFEPAGFKPMRPCLVSAEAYASETDPRSNYFNEGDDGYSLMQREHRVADLARLPEVATREVCEVAYRNFKRLIEAGVGREVARNVLPPDVYYSGYVEAKPRTWLHFFGLRNDHPANAVSTKPQWEIQKVARDCEVLFESMWPMTYSLFNDAGRAL